MCTCAAWTCKVIPEGSEEGLARMGPPHFRLGSSGAAPSVSMRRRGMVGAWPKVE